MVGDPLFSASGVFIIIRKRYDFQSWELGISKITVPKLGKDFFLSNHLWLGFSYAPGRLGALNVAVTS